MRLPADLLRTAGELSGSLEKEPFEPHRATFLAKQLRAQETICRVLCGETFSLEEETYRCFDIRPTWTPETQFEQNMALGETALPGQGSFFDRMQTLTRKYTLPSERSPLVLRFLQEALTEVRRRTYEMLLLPAGEEVSVQTVTGRPGNLAFSWYLGSYRSQIEFNLDVPLDLSRVLEIMSHEGYPGHHAEAVLKEQKLYQDRGYVEHSLDLLIAPQAVISEGLAMLAPGMIFTPGEEQAWLAKHIYPVAGVEPEAVGWGYMRRMSEWSMDVQGNAAFLLREGRPDQEVMQYLMRYLMVTEEQAQPMLVYLKAPFNTARIFSYTAGKRLLQSWLARSDQRLAFSRLLTEPLSPSELAEETSSP
ncbi:MAG TPA: hypothetical protein VNG51_01135 [Ktedonobacteraceae bacterium]|nr:hypothetical protein [Ktedonobacteraceae bacterium]